MALFILPCRLWGPKPSLFPLRLPGGGGIAEEVPGQDGQPEWRVLGNRHFPPEGRFGHQPLEHSTWSEQEYYGLLALDRLSSARSRTEEARVRAGRQEGSSGAQARTFRLDGPGRH